MSIIDKFIIHTANQDEYHKNQADLADTLPLSSQSVRI
jgi:hypothetical protein